MKKHPDWEYVPHKGTWTNKRLSDERGYEFPRNIQVVLVDMDGVLCDYYSAFKAQREAHPEIEYPQSQPRRMII
jgi:hypothetical protein